MITSDHFCHKHLIYKHGMQGTYRRIGNSFYKLEMRRYKKTNTQITFIYKYGKFRL